MVMETVSEQWPAPCRRTAQATEWVGSPWTVGGERTKFARSPPAGSGWRELALDPRALPDHECGRHEDCRGCQRPAPRIANEICGRGADRRLRGWGGSPMPGGTGPTPPRRRRRADAGPTPTTSAYWMTKLRQKTFCGRNRKSPFSRLDRICFEILVSAAMSSSVRPASARSRCSSSPKVFGCLGVPSITFLTGGYYHPSLPARVALDAGKVPLRELSQGRFSAPNKAPQVALPPVWTRTLKASGSGVEVQLDDARRTPR